MTIWALPPSGLLLTVGRVGASMLFAPQPAPQALGRWARGGSALLLCAAALLALSAAAPAAMGKPTPTSQLLHKDVLINADMWDKRPRMMAAGLGFTNIIGVPGITSDDL